MHSQCQSERIQKYSVSVYVEYGQVCFYVDSTVDIKDQQQQQRENRKRYTMKSALALK